jgi:hypothetical protein
MVMVSPETVVVACALDPVEVLLEGEPLGLVDAAGLLGPPPMHPLRAIAIKIIATMPIVTIVFLAIEFLLKGIIANNTHYNYRLA